MKRRFYLSLVWFTLLWYLFSGIGFSQTINTISTINTASDLIITEISPASTPAWIELYNPGPKAVSATGLNLVINDNFTYPIPVKLATVPAHGFIIVSLDGKGAAADIYQYRNNAAALHGAAQLSKVIQPKNGQMGVYRAVKGKNRLLDFVAWGAPATQKSLTPERNRIWRSRWFVAPAASFGDNDPNTTFSSGTTLGLYANRKTGRFSDWTVYTQEEASPGRLNPVPRTTLFTLSDNAVVRSEDIVIAWKSGRDSAKFQFQLAKDPDFKNLTDDKKLDKPFYKPDQVLPEGVYYYRVKVLDPEGGQSAWSPAMKLISQKMGAKKDGADGATEKVLDAMVHIYQRKDTGLLCLDGCASEFDGTTAKHWDNNHPAGVPVVGDHGDMNCARASMAMMCSFYGKTISQDRISYYTEEESPTAGNGIPEGDLAHDTGMNYSAEETAALEWALNETTEFFDTPNPSFAQLQGWLDANRPIMTRKPGHLRTMNGYRIDDANVQWVHIMDPWSGPRWETYTTWNANARGTWVGPVSAPDAREDEPTIALDSDGDGVMDFDEQNRFLTGRYDPDSDNDGVWDKNDIREYVFNATDHYSKRDADFDLDGRRKELDPDNDGDGRNDGAEDKNFNGKYESALGETNNFLVDGVPVVPTKPIHAIIVFDRSGSMAGISADLVKKYDAASSAALLFLDTWLANSPPANTKAGLVFYDHHAYYDLDATENTTLALLNAAKRDQINQAFLTNKPTNGTTSIGGGILKAMEADGLSIDTIPAADQNRLLLVLTDGMENTPPYMNDPAVSQKIVSGLVNGYVLGIGDETQIDVGKLNTLADILNHTEASLAKDMEDMEIEKFFLQALAEIQGLEFTTDPVYSTGVGKTTSHQVMVGSGAKSATFVIAWNTPNVKLSMTLKGPDGKTVIPEVIKSNTFYQVAVKNQPKPGVWTLSVTAAKSGTTPPPATFKFNLMGLEKNETIKSHFTVKGSGLTGERLLLTANLAQNKLPVANAEVWVEIVQPNAGLGNFLADTVVRTNGDMDLPEKLKNVSLFDQKRQLLALSKSKVPMINGRVKLNDQGVDGDEIPGDGKYSGYFTKTKFDGIYSFRFVVRSGAKFTREKTLSVSVIPEIRASKSKVDELTREFNAKNNLTYVTMTVIPMDRFGNKVGPGRADLLKISSEGKITKVTDKLDGSYEVVVAVPGEYKKTLNLLSVPKLYRLNLPSE